VCEIVRRVPRGLLKLLGSFATDCVKDSAKDMLDFRRKGHEDAEG